MAGPEAMNHLNDRILLNRSPWLPLMLYTEAWTVLTVIHGLVLR
jgi:hypothetical protein